MAHAIEVTIGTGNKISLNYQSQEVNVSVTYKLEREDKDVLMLVREKANELVRAHALAWKRVKEGDAPQPTTNEGVKVAEAPVGAEPQAQENAASIAQLQLIRSLARQAGLGDEELETRMRQTIGRDVAEDLNYEQAARLLVELGREGRERFERTRARNSNITLGENSP